MTKAFIHIRFRPLMWTFLLALLAGMISCKKQDNWLNVNSSNFADVPSTLQDFQAMLDNSDNYMNTYYPTIGQLGTDNYYLTSTELNALPQLYEANAYLWVTDIFADANKIEDWNSPYIIVEYANIVLDGLANIAVGPGNLSAYNNLKGSALFFRAFAFYNLAQLFCKPYVAATAIADMGIPLRLTSDVNVKSVRATVQQTYDQIINDLKTAGSLLPINPLYITRPSVSAVDALLAKTYLTMGDYSNAEVYADSTLTKFNALLDYNTLSATSSRPFPFIATGTSGNANNPEIIFYARGNNYVIYPGSSAGLVDTTLYNSYRSTDLRKALLFKAATGGQDFKGSYGYSYIFSGIAADEIYLIRAECYARANNTSLAMQDLNALLQKRYMTGTFQNLTAPSTDSALTLILSERRKELPFTAQIRWEDLRRLNQDPRFAITLTRVVNGTTYTLPPNDPRYVYPIPDYEIQLSGIQQNTR